MSTDRRMDKKDVRYIIYIYNIFLIYLYYIYLIDILECEVKWALESITTNKASGGDKSQLNYSKS